MIDQKRDVYSLEIQKNLSAKKNIDIYRSKEGNDRN
jgi:hypothetical protein